MQPELILDKYIKKQYINKEFHIDESQYNNKHKMWFPTGMFQQKKYYTIPAQSTMVYSFIRSYVVRGVGKNPFLTLLKTKFYDNNLLACSKSQRDIAKGMGWERSKVYKWIKPLIELGIIFTQSIDVGNYKDQTVYIIGTVDQNGDERYFIDTFINS